MKYRITAHHTQGQSISHCCTTGAISDPAELLDLTIIGTEDEAYEAGVEGLVKLVEDHQSNMCACNKNHYYPGSNSWWESVSIVTEAID